MDYGDIVVLHYSGHGQQIYDDDGDEIDGYDEAIIPYDGKISFKTGKYGGENHLRDDELGRMINQIRKKIGQAGDVIVILDSCHSGTATRDFSPSRGTDIKFEIPINVQ